MGQPSPPARVLFVWVENSCRSQMAEAFARAYGAGIIEPSSAGSRPAPAAYQRARPPMQERGVDMSGQVVKAIYALPQAIVWDRVATMGCGESCPALPALQRLEWDLPDPKALPDEGFRRVGDEMERRVCSLLYACSGRRH